MNTAARGSLAALAAMLASAAFAPAHAADARPCTPQEQSNQTLGEQLNQSNGVICPPEIDPEMKAPTPPGGSTPVIPLPGSPGGNPNVQPK